MSKAVKIWLIIAASLILVGGLIFVGAMTVNGWDFAAMSTYEYETNEYEITEEFTSISIVTDVTDVELISADGEKCIVECYEETGLKHEVSVKGGTLTIELTDTRKWYEHIGIGFGSSKITVRVPKEIYDKISVKTSTGDIKIENISASSIALNLSTGESTLRDIECKSLLSEGSTGDISMERLVATEKILIERDTGDVSFNACDAAEIFVETDTGDVRGSLLSQKVFITNTDTGKVSVPNSIEGGRCKIDTDTGDIILTVK